MSLFLTFHSCNNVDLLKFCLLRSHSQLRQLAIPIAKSRLIQLQRQLKIISPVAVHVVSLGLTCHHIKQIIAVIQVTQCV